MAASKQIVLITGGNSGIGKCLAGLLMADKSKHVIITSRSIEKGEAAVKELKAENGNGSIEMLQLDQTEQKSIASLAESVEKTHGRLDALVNNAASVPMSPDITLFDQMQGAFAANVTGPAILVQTFLPLLKNSNTIPRILNVSSGMGSISYRLGEPGKAGPLHIPYQTSKAALNMLGACEVTQYADEKLKIFTYCPGFTVSNLSSMNISENGAQPTVDGTRPMLAILNGEKDSQHGHFLNHEGGEHPW